MKKLFALFLMGTMVASTFTACEKDKNVVGIAEDDARFSILVSALNRAGLVSVLEGDGPFTVFAPTNDAFNTFLSANGFANIDAVPVAVLTQVLLNHVVAGEVLSTDLSTGYVNTEAYYNGEMSKKLSMYVNVSAAGVRLNGVANVTQPDLQATNGVVHVVDAVIGLPTVVTHAAANPAFTTLVAAVGDTDLTQNYVNVLSGVGPFTVFAPTNDAFAALLGVLGLASVNDVPAATLEGVLLYHVVGANVRSNELSNGQVVATLNGSSFTVNINGTSVTLDTGGNASNVAVVATDVQCANGVIHVVDQVMLP
jgi:uncharacterized surface protein with fasciclin (FAS1) repeats